MMCAEKLQRLMMASVLVLAGVLLGFGSIYGFILLGFTVVMIVVWAITDFCPSIWALTKFFGHCKNHS